MAFPTASPPCFSNLHHPTGRYFETKGLTQKIALFLYRIGLKEACCVFFQNESMLGTP